MLLSMFRLAVLCADAKVEDDHTLSVSHMFRVVWTPVFPFVHPSMALACSLEVPASMVNERVLIQGHLIDPEGHTHALVCQYSCLLVTSAPTVPVLNFVMPLRNVSFPVPGDYMLELSIDGIKTHSIDLRLCRSA